MTRDCVAASTVAVLLLVSSASCQGPPQPFQVNSASARLSVNGTGGIRWSNSDDPAWQLGEARGHRHRSAAHAALEIRVEGAAFQPIILATGPAVTPINVAGHLIELAPYTLLVNGLSPVSIIDFTAVTNASGVWSIVLPTGLPSGVQFNLQAVVIDLSNPGAWEASAAVTVSVREDVDTLFRNISDALVQASSHPAYLLSLLSAGFLNDGQDAAALLSQQIQDLSALPADASLRYVGVLPNGLSAPPLPTTLCGAPASPADQAICALELIDDYGVDGCGPGVARSERSRSFDLGVVAEAVGSGSYAWRVDGNQQPAEVTATAHFVMDVTGSLRHFVEFYVGQTSIGGGISSITVTGPQLADVDQSGWPYRALDGASGTLPASSLFGDDWWFQLEVNVPNPASPPPALQPRVLAVETPAGLGDTYIFSLTYNDGTTSPPILRPLRAAFAPQNPAAAALIPGAIPTAGAGSITSTGTSFSIPLDLGIWPDPRLADSVRIEAFFTPGGPQPIPGFGSGLSIAFEDDSFFGPDMSGPPPLAWPACLGATPGWTSASGPQTMTLCENVVGNWMFVIERSDVFGANYVRELYASGL